MMIRSTVRASRAPIALLAAAMLVLSACASTEEEAAPEPTGSEFEQGAVEEAVENVGGRGAASDFATIYFDLDRSEIREDARPVLRTNADQIKNAGTVLTIEGHCDERGNEEYNLALGERRAYSVKKYLVNLGVPASELRTVSYGEAKPAVQGHDEQAWRWNRRAEFRLR
ncbi:MAG: peptidoglycan-associated lipoprotein Pal [Proteobacteria bacterium]|nr:peptidoglycan-associated lipoprotein Pal [Pseudomonadota bacterium]MCZ6782436.1 peptidoglycan-associated lipoprotein Pal [Pseudomonadota bacterium]